MRLPRVQAQIHLIRPIPTATSTFLSTPVALDPRGPHAVLSGVSHGTVDQNVAQVISLLAFVSMLSEASPPRALGCA